jgi:anti-sigma factor RsiW
VTCREWSPLVSALVDGDLDEKQAAEVAAHIAGCANCAREKDEISRMVAAAGALPAVEPPPHLWTRIDAQLASDPPRRAPIWRRWLLIPALGVAACAAVTVGVLRHRAAGPSDAALLADAQSEFQQAEGHYQRAVSDLRIIAARERERWPQDRAARYDSELAALDATVEKARAAARARAADPDAEEHLYGAYRAQIAFLEQSLLPNAEVLE